MHRIHLKISLLLLLFIVSCLKKEESKPLVKNYLDIAHTRTESVSKVDSIIEKIDYSQFDMLWLGGDITCSTSHSYEILSYVDSIFNIGSPNTLWSLGNHDYSDLHKIQIFTHRPAYYSYFRDGITFIVLDTQDSLSNIVGKQKEFFDGIVDTIQNSTYLIVLLHKLIWMYGDSCLESHISTVSNGELGDCFYCINPNNFYTDIYPKLLKVKRKGIKVLCVSGDIGTKVKEFEYVTPDSICFLASGISSGTMGNKALLFHNDITNKKLTWEYKPINELKSK